ncbi:MAG: dethiobiotin synthase [Alphaproteobacteria bacterium]|nr:dethiobiotin synthase [Alphaproteobacteria bacterium]
MSKQFIITGTGTGIGKTLTSSILMLGLDADYWKPLQSGTPTDTETVKSLTALPSTRFHPETYAFKHPLSPHIAAEMEGITIDVSRIKPPQTTRPLLMEGAGGLMVPITRNLLMIDLFKSLQAPVILCALTELGTINHTILSVEALRARGIPLLGIIFIGPEMQDTIQTILDFTKTKMLGHIPLLADTSVTSLKNTFNNTFNKNDFA